MNTITLEPFVHNLKSCIGLKFPYDFRMKEIVKKIEGVRWTQTHRCFYIVYDELTVDSFKKKLMQLGFHITGCEPVTVEQNRKGVTTGLKPLNIEKTSVFRGFMKSLE